MDILILIKAAIMGVVEGLTEFLPISSTGHLILAGDLLGFNDERGKVFEIVIQFAAILAVCWEYRAKLTAVASGLARKEEAAQRFTFNLFIAFLPLAILGLLFGLIALAVFGGIAGIVGMNADMPDAAVAVPILGAIGGLIALFALLVSIPGIIAGVGLLSFKPWARVLAIVLSIINLINFPFGTALGFYGIWVLFSRDGSALFERRPVPAAYMK